MQNEATATVYQSHKKLFYGGGGGGRGLSKNVGSYDWPTTKN